MKPRIAVIIPARLKSKRYPGKVLAKFFGLPMIEHVRRRVLLCPGVDEVVIATCDPEIVATVRSFGGKTIKTSDAHPTGTDRIAEACVKIDCTHVIDVQGDEILFVPGYLAHMIRAIKSDPEVPFWNATAPIEKADELDRHSVVKCAVTKKGRILFCFRRSPCFGKIGVGDKSPVRRIMGLSAFRKPFLRLISKTKPTPIELSESIEQLRILESGFELRSVGLERGYPSVNVPAEAKLAVRLLKTDPLQKKLLARVLSARRADH